MTNTFSINPFPEKTSNRLLILGIGNPYMGDDAVGIELAKALQNMIPENRFIEIKDLSVGGLDMVEHLLGYQEVILIDSIINPKHKTGTILELNLHEFELCHHATSPHTMSFWDAWRLVTQIDQTLLPKTLTIFAIVIDPVSELKEGLSPTIEKAKIEAIELVLEYLRVHGPLTEKSITINYNS